ITQGLIHREVAGGDGEGAIVAGGRQVKPAGGSELALAMPAGYAFQNDGAGGELQIAGDFGKAIWEGSIAEGGVVDLACKFKGDAVRGFGFENATSDVHAAGGLEVAQDDASIRRQGAAERVVEWDIVCDELKFHSRVIRVIVPCPAVDSNAR